MPAAGQTRSTAATIGTPPGGGTRRSAIAPAATNTIDTVQEVLSSLASRYRADEVLTA